MLDIVNALYTSQVVERVQSHGIVVTHDYANKKGAIPLPARFTIEFGELIGEPVRVALFWKHIRWDITRYYLPSAIVGARQEAVSLRHGATSLPPERLARSSIS